MFNKQPNTPNASFLIKVSTFAGEHILWYRVDQVLTNHKDSGQWLKMAEVIKGDLRYNTSRTGLNYELFHYCLSWHMDAFIEEHGVEVS